MFYTRQALLKSNPVLITWEYLLTTVHVLHMAIFTLLSQDVHDREHLIGLRSKPKQKQTQYLAVMYR